MASATEPPGVSTPRLGRGDFVKWFGDAVERRPTVAQWRINAVRGAPAGAAFLPASVAWFAAHSMLHGGLFSGLQVDQWLRTHDRRWPLEKSADAQASYRKRFVQPYFTARFSGRPFAHSVRFPGGATFAHFWSRPAYRAVGVENSRYRRTAPSRLVMQRLLAYDYVLERPDLGWIGDSGEKLQLFDALGVPRDELPHKWYRPGARPPAAADEAAAEPRERPPDKAAFFPSTCLSAMGRGISYSFCRACPGAWRARPRVRRSIPASGRR